MLYIFKERTSAGAVVVKKQLARKIAVDGGIVKTCGRERRSSLREIAVGSRWLRRERGAVVDDVGLLPPAKWNCFS